MTTLEQNAAIAFKTIIMSLIWTLPLIIIMIPLTKMITTIFIKTILTITKMHKPMRITVLMNMKMMNSSILNKIVP